jgi:hypothetical protein
MKKALLFTLLVTFSACFGMSQNLSLSDSAGPITKGAFRIFKGTPDSPLIISYVWVTNGSTANIDVMCRKIIIDTVPGSENTYCWAGSCYPPDVYLSLDATPIGAGQTDKVSFIGEYNPKNHVGITIVRYSFFDRSNPSDSTWFDAHYQAFPLGIEDMKAGVSISNPYPNPANSYAVCDYAIPAGIDAQIILRNLLGTTLQEIPLTDLTGKVKLDTGQFPEGIYFYSVVIDGKVAATRKLVVSR